MATEHGSTLADDLVAGVAAALHAPETADVNLTLSDGGEAVLCAHRLVLAIRCPAFLRALRLDLAAELPPDALPLPVFAAPEGVDVATLSALLEYAYRDTLAANADSRAVYLASTRYCLPRLAHLCEQRLAAQLLSLIHI